MVVFTMYFAGGTIPNYIVVTQWLGLQDSVWSIILPNAISTFNLLVMKSFIAGLQEEQEENMELIMGVPLEISVEIGRTKKLVKDILDFTKGSLVVLDKLAGEQVDLFVNGQCIAKGDVVVVEDNFGIRITEITKINLATLE